MIGQKPMYRKRNIPWRTLLVKFFKDHSRGWFNIFINNLTAKCSIAVIEGIDGCK